MKKGITFFTIWIIPYLIYSQAFKIDPIKEDTSLNSYPSKTISGITIIGNKITKEQIILRELTFKVGDTLSNVAFIAELTQSKKNLLNTSLFNFANIQWALIDSASTQIVIELQERWYTFVFPIFEIDDNNFNTWWRDKDFSRINYGVNVSRTNFRGRKEKLTATAQYGFTERYRLKYEIPYITKGQKLGIDFNFSYNRRDEIAYSTLDNERLQYKSADQDAVRNLSSGITFKYRPAIFTTHAIGLEYDLNSIQDSVRVLNPNYLGNNLLRTEFFSFFYDLKVDLRDSRNYPLVGFFGNINIKQYGLEILQSPVNFANFQINLKKYWALHDRWYLAGSFRGVLATSDKQPYLLQNGLGYSSFGIRAYEYYVIDGQNIALTKAQIRYQLVKPNYAKLDLIPIEKFNKFHYAFYLGLFTDFAYVRDNVGFNGNSLANEMQFGTGIALDFVTYYDVVIRTEFSINKLGENGIFIHFVAPI